MRGPLVGLLACIATATACSRSAAEQPFPYRAFITADDVYVRSGPGENYYPTDKLKAGTEVEVYRHDPGGWFAIRPPKDSFSWVSSHHLRLDGGNLATVTADRVVARVGSRMSNTRDVIQVHLRKGEVVEVLESPRNRMADDNGSSAWYKIAPPAGEFRWIPGRYVDTDYDRDGLRRTSTRGTVDLTGQALGRLPGDGFAPPPASRYPTSAAQYQKQLDELDLELSAVIVEDPSFWELSELRQRAETLFNQAETALERGRADAGEQDRAVRRHQASQTGIGRRPAGVGLARPAARQPLAAGRPGRPLRRQGPVDPRSQPQTRRSAICDSRRHRQHSLLRLACPRRKPAELRRPPGRHQRHPRIHARAEGQPRHGAARERRGEYAVEMTGNGLQYRATAASAF